MGIVVLGTAIASAVTSSKVEDLKREINYIVNQHKDISDKATKITQKLQKFNLNQISQKLNDMNNRLSQNLRTIIADQQIKLEMIKKIDTTRYSETPQTLLQGIFQILNLISTVFTLIEIMCATNPTTIVISGIVMVLNTILSVFTLINNITTIGELEKKKAELEQYFYGGRFQCDLRNIALLSYQMVENFYVFVMNFNSIMKELAININLLSISRNSQKLDFQHYIDLINENPFDPEFQYACYSNYLQFIAIQKYPLEERVNMSCKLLEKFEGTFDIVEILRVVQKIASKFSNNSDVGKELQRASASFRSLTILKERFERHFVKRKQVDRSELPNYDKRILSYMLDEFKGMEEKQLSMVEVVSFFTTEFFGDDPMGQTLFKMNLKEVFAKSQFLNYLGVTSDHQNIIYLPEPTNESLKKEWNSHRSYLERLYKSYNPQADFTFQKLFIKIENGQFAVQDGSKTQLNFYYGILLKRRGSKIAQYFTEDMRFVSTKKTMAYSAPVFKESRCSSIMKKEEEAQEKVQRFEEQGEDLDSLCNYVCFVINGIAYPERTINFHISKVENKYKAVLEWIGSTVRPEFFGKTIKYSIEERRTTEMQQRILFSETIEESQNLVVFSQK